MEATLPAKRSLVMSRVKYQASVGALSCLEVKQSCCFRVESIFKHMDLAVDKNTKAALQIKSESCSWHLQGGFEFGEALLKYEILHATNDDRSQTTLNLPK